MTQPTLIYSQPVMRPPNPFGPVPGAQVCMLKNCYQGETTAGSIALKVFNNLYWEVHCTSTSVHVRIAS